MVVILMMPAKLATLGLLIIKVLWSQGNDIIASVHGVINNFYHLNINFEVALKNRKTVFFTSLLNTCQHMTGIDELA